MININMKKITTLAMSILVMTLLVAGCNSKKMIEEPQVSNSAENPEVINNTEEPDVSNNTENPRVQIEMQDGGIMVLELYPEFAPETVQNFINLAQSGFYDGLTFHRIIKGFMIQGGDPSGDGTGGANKNIKGEFSENGFLQNTLEHTKGIISMARSGDPDSASSQFFIVDGDASFLDGKYAAFGKLIEGEEVLEAISDTPVARGPYSKEVSIPQEDVVIKNITVMGTDKK